MYLMYIDESGDCGLNNSPTRFFVLTGVVIHESGWRAMLDALIALRRDFKQKFSLNLRDEIHASAMLNRPGPLVRIPKQDRLTMLRKLADAVAAVPNLQIVNVVVDKLGKPEGFDVFEAAWKALIQRFENTLFHGNFGESKLSGECGLVVPDRTDDKKLTRLLRRMRRYNPIPGVSGSASRNRVVCSIVEDPVFRDSQHSLFIQAADCCAFLLYQHLCPSAYVRKKSAHNYFLRLAPVLCRYATPKDPNGIVRL